MLEELLYESVVHNKPIDSLRGNILELTATNKLSLAKQVIYYLQNGCLEQEEVVLTTILQALIENNDDTLCRYLADTTMFLPNLDKQIALQIANTFTAETAASFLLEYPGFTKQDLLIICQNTSDLAKLRLISMRPDLTERVISLLLKTKDFKIALNIINNRALPFALSYYEVIIRHFQDQPLCVEAIATREDLNSQLVDQLAEFFSSSNKYKFLSHYIHRISHNQQESLLRKITPNLDAYSESQLLKKVDLLYSRNQLFSFVVMRFLYTGDLLSFMYCLAKLADVPFGYLKFAFNSGYNEVFFQDIYQKANLPANMMAATSKILSIVVNKLINNEITAENYRSVLVQELLRDRGEVRLYKVQYLIELLEKS